MYEEDGINMQAVFESPKGERHTLFLDDEAFAYLLNEGWVFIEELRKIHRDDVPRGVEHHPPLSVFREVA
jgi:hypothetical protein